MIHLKTSFRASQNASACRSFLVEAGSLRCGPSRASTPRKTSSSICRSVRRMWESAAGLPCPSLMKSSTKRSTFRRGRLQVLRLCGLGAVGVAKGPIIPYNYYKLPYNYYPFLREFCNATKHYQPRRMNVGISRERHIPGGVELHWKSVRMCVEHRRGLAKHTSSIICI
jgi:hypothetical protein